MSGQEPDDSEPEIVDLVDSDYDSDYDSDTEIESDNEIDTTPQVDENTEIFLVCIDDVPRCYANTLENASQIMNKLAKQIVQERTWKQGTKCLLETEEDSVNIWGINDMTIFQYNTLLNTITVRSVSKGTN